MRAGLHGVTAAASNQSAALRSEESLRVAVLLSIAGGFLDAFTWIAHHGVMINRFGPGTLPQKMRSYRVRGPINGIGRREHTPEHAVVVIRHKGHGEQKQHSGRRDSPSENRSTWMRSLGQPPRECADRGHANEQTLIGAAVGENGQTKREDETLLPT